MKEITKEMLALAAKGNRYAIEDLYEITYNSVYKTVRILISDEDTVLDILQDSYVKAFQSLEQLQDPDNFRPWLKRIATNKAKDYLKKKKPILFSEMAAEDGEEIDFRDENIAHLPEEVLDRKETVRLMDEILASLSDDQRMAISLHYYQDLSIKEIAGIMGCSENTVKSRLNYGRKKVEQKVRELEKRGTKLYSLAPLPFLLWLFRMDADAAEIPSAAVLEGITARCAVGSSVSAGAAGAKAAATTGAKALTAKIVAGVLAVAVAGGGAALALSSNERKEARHIQETIFTETILPAEQETAAAETAEETIPALAAEEAYQVVTAEYQTVLAMDRENFLEAPYIYFNGDHAAVVYYHMYREGSFHYAYYDIDGNGVEELLIGSGPEEYIRIVDIYGFDGVQAVQLVDEPTLGDRSQLTLMEDGSLYLYGSNGAASGVHKLWRIGGSGYALDEIYEYSFDFMEVYDGIYHGADGSTVTEGEFQTMMASYIPVTEIPWMPLAVETEESEVGSGGILADIREALNISTEDYDSDTAYYDSQYRHLGEGVMWMLMHRQAGDYTMCIWSTCLDIDGDGQEELCIGRGVSPSDTAPIVIYRQSGKVIFGDALYAYTDLFYGGAPVAWDYLGG